MVAKTPASKIMSVLVLLLIVMIGVNVQAVDNPVSYESEINDCDVIKYNGEYYIQGNWLKGDMLSSRDLVSWGQRKHVFSWNNTWHTQDHPTDPDYDIHGTHIRYHNGTFHLYAHLGVVDGITHAVSSNIWGPYAEPVNSAFAQWIDADTFKDDNSNLYFYSTQISSGERIYGYTMSDPNTITSSRDEQISASGGWEGSSINEGSKVFKYRGRYYMIYNANGTTDPNYALGCVEASSPLGFNNSGKYSTQILKRTGTRPAGEEIHTIGQPWMVEGVNGFEKWLGYFAVTTSDGRTQRIDRMHFFDRTLYVEGPSDRYSTGYHPAPAKPQYGATFSTDAATLPPEWTASGGIWSVANGELRQSASGSPRATLNQTAAENYLFEINLKFNGSTTDQQAGARVYYVDDNNWMIVGIHQTATPGVNNFYYHLREGGVDNVQAVSLAESVMDLNVYHKIRVQRSGNTFKIKLDDVIHAPVDVATASSFGPSQVALYANNADVSFDGVIYTVGWDEYGSEVQDWEQIAGSRTYGSDGVSINNGYAHKGDLMPEYEFAAQVYQTSGDGGMGFTAVAIDGDNWLDGRINTATDTLEIFGKYAGVDIPYQSANLANKSNYNLRAVKLSDRVIFFVDGEEKLTINQAFGPSRVGLVSWGMTARFNGIMAYQTEPDVVPTEWTVSDVGSPGFAGTIKEYDNALYMTGSGADIWDLSDEFAFAHKDISGDFEFTTRVVNHDKTHYWAKAGLMFRDNLAANSAMVHLNVSPHDIGDGRAYLHWRDVAGGGTGHIDAPAFLNFPIWLKLKRVGGTFNGYYSSDGQIWTPIGSVSPPVAASGKLGYSLCALDNNRIARAMFDNSELVVPLTPGSVGNSQVIYEDELPAAFTSTAPAAGNDPVAYQWQQTLTPAVPASWTDIPGATGATYAFPSQYGAYPSDTTIYARRKATDAYYTDYSNEVSLRVDKLFDTSGPRIFIDNFNVADTTDVNLDLATRQAGGGGTSTYTGHMPHYSITGGKLKNLGVAGFLSQDKDMGHFIVGQDFEFSFKVAVPDTSGNWSSIYLHDETYGGSDPRADSRMGIYFLGAANSSFVGAIYHGTGSHLEEGITVAEVEALTGATYNKEDEHAFTFVSHAIAGTYDLWIDGVKVRSGMTYAFDGAERRIGIVGTMSSQGAFYDDIALRYYGTTYTKWADDNSLSGTDALLSTDIEGDGLDNLAEYAVGGNPGLADVLPPAEIVDLGGGSNLFRYVYHRRRDAAARGLLYGLSYDLDLVDTNDWVYVGTLWETDTAIINADFESVTNEVEITGVDQGFLRLEITLD